MYRNLQKFTAEQLSFHCFQQVLLFLLMNVTDKGRYFHVLFCMCSFLNKDEDVKNF